MSKITVNGKIYIVPSNQIKEFKTSKKINEFIEFDELSIEDIEAASEMYDDLRNSDFYEKQDKALKTMYGEKAEIHFLK